MVRTLSVHWHVQISNLTIDAEDVAEVVFIDVFGEFLYNDLQTHCQLGYLNSGEEMFETNLRASDRTGASSTADAASLASVSAAAISSRSAACRTRRDCPTGSGGRSGSGVSSRDIGVWGARARATANGRPRP